MSFLKNFGLGLLYILLLPILAVGIALVAVWAVANFLIQGIKVIVGFFHGDKLFPPLDEDLEAMAIEQRAIDAQKMAASQPQGTPIFVQNNMYPGNPYGVPPTPPAPPVGAPTNPGVSYREPSPTPIDAPSEPNGLIEAHPDDSFPALGGDDDE